MRTFIIGDVHGCYNTFLKLLEDISFNKLKDSLFCAGDLIDRGKYSLDIIDYFYNKYNYAKSVRGNHDDKYLRYLKGNKVQLSEKDGNYGSHYDNSDFKEENIEFFESLPLVLHPTENTTVVHAGFYPWQNHLAFPETFDKKKKACMYIRHIQNNMKLVDSGGKNVTEEINNKNMFFDESLPMWYDLYKEQEYGGTVFFGHQPMKEPLIVEGKTRIIGLDTGACFDNKLTVFCLEENNFYSVNTLKEDLDKRSIREL